jgi:hypothetical protein
MCSDYLYADSGHFYINEKFCFNIDSLDQFNVSVIRESETDGLYQISEMNLPNNSIYIYAFKSNSEIDLVKFSEVQTDFIKSLGYTLSSEKNFLFWFFFLESIDKRFKESDVITRIRFVSDSNLGLMIIGQETPAIQDIFNLVYNNLELDISLIHRAKVWLLDSLSGYMGLFLLIVVILVLISMAYLLGKIGAYIRIQSNLIDHINKELKVNKDHNRNTALLNLRSQSYHRLYGIPAGILFIYSISFIYVPSQFFMIMLVGIIPIILGYFGMFFSVDVLEDLF